MRLYFHVLGVFFGCEVVVVIVSCDIWTRWNSYYGEKKTIKLHIYTQFTKGKITN